MTIKAIKKRMLEYRDVFGGDIPDTDDIINARTKKQLAGIIEKHRSFLECMLADAHSHLDNFKTELGLNCL